MDMIVDSEKLTWLEKEPSKSFKRSRSLKEVAVSIANGGGSSHSARGDTLKLLLTYLERAGVSYQLTAHPKCGYYIQGIPRKEWMDKND
jgi:hypothetical protein